MVEHGKILVALDDSAASWKAVDYVVALVRDEPRLVIHLFHAASYPPELQEFRGAEDAREEEELEKQLKHKQKGWEQDIESAAAPLFKKARAALEWAGAAPEQIQSQTLALKHPEDLVDEILKSAYEFGCGTIVVGRNSFPWLKEIFVDHVGQEISRKAQDISVRIIE
jgi:nucleotide-binding universal stress UspA family protein